MFCVIVFLSFGIGNCNVISFPRNTAVVSGQSVEIECRTSSGSIVRQWTFERLSDGRKFRILRNWGSGLPKLNPDFAHFGVKIDENGSGVIYKNNTDLEDAGIYTCSVEVYARVLQHSAVLIVLASDPVCNEVVTHYENETQVYAEMQCSVQFRGCWSPIMEWRQIGGDNGVNKEGRLLKDRIDIVPSQTSTVRSSITVVADTYLIACRTFFRLPKDNATVNGTTGSSECVQVSASNAPGYTYMWKTLLVPITSSSAVLSETSSMAKDHSSAITHTVAPVDEKYSVLLWLVGSMAAFICLMGITAVAYCIRTIRQKGKASLGDDSHQDVCGSVDFAESVGYEVLPYAISDGYDQIEEVAINEGVISLMTEQSPPTLPPMRNDSDPITGYSELTQTEQPFSAVYCRIDPYENPDDEKDDEAIKDSDQYSSQQHEEHIIGLSEHDCHVVNQPTVNHYLTLTVDAEQNDSEDDEIPSSYLRMFYDVENT